MTIASEGTGAGSAAPPRGQVFVVDRGAVFGGRWPQGFIGLRPREGRILQASLRRLGRFESRDHAERHPAWKQLIPYCVVTRAGATLVVRRHRAQGETRLHGLLSLGLGGHVEPPDEGSGDLFETALRRELEEELVIPGIAHLAPVFAGLLNDDSTAVGRVHAGLVYRLELPARAVAEGDVRIREIHKMSGGFRRLGSDAANPQPPDLPRPSTPVVERAILWQDPARFESWSRILLEAGFGRAGSFSHEAPQTSGEVRSEE